MNKFLLSSVSFISFSFMFHNVSLANEKMSTIKIETTIPYLTDLVKQASCDSKSFQIENIISVGSDPHTFHMTPSNRIAIAKADVIISIGSGLEPWISKIQKNKNQTWFTVTENMSLTKLDGGHTHSHDHDHDLNHDHETKEHNHLEYDPHIWQSPKLTKEALLKISNLLIKLKPNEEININKCTQNYIHKMEIEIKELKKQIETIPLEKRVIATNHDALGYFANEFGFKIKSIVGLSDEASPTPAQLKDIIMQIKKENITALFLESTGNMRNIKTVSKETGVKIGGTLYSDSLGTKGSGAETAPEMWKTNVSTILNALKK